MNFDMSDELKKAISKLGSAVGSAKRRKGTYIMLNTEDAKIVHKYLAGLKYQSYAIEYRKL